MRNVIALGASAAALFAVGAFAHSGATGIVKQRMDGMKEMSHAVKAIGAVKAGAIPFSFETLNLAGREIAKHGIVAKTQFPEGSITGPSEALPAIWSDRETFDRLMQQMISAAEKMSVSKDRDESLVLATRIGSLCKDCHAKFREKK